MIIKKKTCKCFIDKLWCGRNVTNERELMGSSDGWALIKMEVIRSTPGLPGVNMAEVTSWRFSSWAFGTAPDRPYISAGVAAYHYGSLDCLFCTLLLFGRENVQTSRGRFSAGAFGWTCFVLKEQILYTVSLSLARHDLSHKYLNSAGSLPCQSSCTLVNIAEVQRRSQCQWVSAEWFY